MAFRTAEMIAGVFFDGAEIIEILSGTAPCQLLPMRRGFELTRKGERKECRWNGEHIWRVGEEEVVTAFL